MVEQAMDPDVPKLRAAREHLAKLVAEGKATPEEASAVIGKLADGLRHDKAGAMASIQRMLRHTT